MNHRLFRPFRLIKVESILPYLTVVRDQPLVVHPRHIPLVARRAGKIEHVPDERAPRETAALDGIVSLFVHRGLPFFGMEHPVGLRRLLSRLPMMPHVCAGSILAHGDTLVPTLAVPPLQCGFHFRRLRPIPSRIGVERHDVGHGVFRTLLHICGQHRQPSRVFAVRHVIEFRNQSFHIPFGQLVAQAPTENGRVIEILPDEFRQFRFHVLREFRGIQGFADQRNLGPDQHALAVAQGVKLVRMRIMCQPDAVGTDFLDE